MDAPDPAPEPTKPKDARAVADALIALAAAEGYEIMAANDPVQVRRIEGGGVMVLPPTRNWGLVPLRPQ